jgi:hypothetical protein
VQEADGEEDQDMLTIRHMDNEELAFNPSTLSLIDPSIPTPKFELAVTGKAFGIILMFLFLKIVQFLNRKKFDWRDILLADYKNKTEKFPFELIITAGTVWARMTPENKVTDFFVL